MRDFLKGTTALGFGAAVLAAFLPVIAKGQQVTPGLVVGPTNGGGGGNSFGNILNNGTITGATTIIPGTSFISAQTFAGPVSKPAPLLAITGQIHGSIGNGGATRAQSYNPYSLQIDDFVVNNNASIEVGFLYTYNAHNITGGRVVSNIVFNQLGPITRDFDPVLSRFRAGSFGLQNLWGTLSDNAGGTLDAITGKPHTAGIWYGGNQQILGKATPTTRASLWATSNLYGEGDIGWMPSQQSLTITGSINVGETETLHIASAVNPGFGTVDLAYTNIAGDNAALVANNLGNLVLRSVIHNGTNQIGIGLQGASNVLSPPNVLNIGWPDVTLAGQTDVVVTATTTGAAILTLGTVLKGTSVGNVWRDSTVLLKSNGVKGFNQSAVSTIAHQTNGAGWTSGTFDHLYSFGATGTDPDGTSSATSDSPRTASAGPPFQQDSDLFVYIKNSNYSGQPDAPTVNLSHHSIFFYKNVDFLSNYKNGTPPGPFQFPGYELYGNGAEQIGPGTIRPLLGTTAATSGLWLTASGTIASTATLVSGGGAANTLDMTDRYYPGEIEPGKYGDLWKVLTVGTLGDVVTFGPVCDAETQQHCSFASVPAGATMDATATLDAGTGEGWVISYNQNAAGNIRIGDAGQTTEIFGGVLRMDGTSIWTTNGAVATTMTGIGPTGSHTTVQEWIAVTNTAGTVRYLPAY